LSDLRKNKDLLMKSLGFVRITRSLQSLAAAIDDAIQRRGGRDFAVLSDNWTEAEAKRRFSGHRARRSVHDLLLPRRRGRRPWHPSFSL
jgi:hypothetical protein